MGASTRKQEDEQMDDASIDLQRAARDAAYSMPLDQINPADPELFRTDTH